MLVNRHPVLRPRLTPLRAFLVRAQRHLGRGGEVSVCLTDDLEIRQLNASFRGTARATDVLSFPDWEPRQSPLRRRRLPAAFYLGDIAISLDTAARQAAGQGHTLGREIRILLLHGLLHLHGYDHESDDGTMRRLEESLRRQLQLPTGLITRRPPSRNPGRPAEATV